jgi:hypothetical protein
MLILLLLLVSDATEILVAPLLSQRRSTHFGTCAGVEPKTLSTPNLLLRCSLLL